MRRAWLATFLTRKSAPKGAAVFVATELAHGPHELRRAMEHGRDDMLAQLLGVDTTREVIGAAGKATDARAPVIALAFVLAAYEAATGKHTWRTNDADMTR